MVLLLWIFSEDSIFTWLPFYQIREKSRIEDLSNQRNPITTVSGVDPFDLILRTGVNLPSSGLFGYSVMGPDDEHLRVNFASKSNTISSVIVNLSETGSTQRRFYSSDPVAPGLVYQYGQGFSSVAHLTGSARSSGQANVTQPLPSAGNEQVITVTNVHGIGDATNPVKQSINNTATVQNTSASTVPFFALTGLSIGLLPVGNPGAAGTGDEYILDIMFYDGDILQDPNYQNFVDSYLKVQFPFINFGILP